MAAVSTPPIKTVSCRFFPIALALFAYSVAGAPIVAAQQMWPDPAKTVYPRSPAKSLPFAPTPALPAKPQPALPEPALERPIVFYLAHGETDACGPRCSEWIAAEGKIDAGGVGRLQHLLAKMHGPLPPLYLQSLGGQVFGAIALGRLVRARKLTVSVGHTIPLVCDRDPLSAKTCEAQIGSGGTVEARMDPATTICASACVYVLAGGATRLIPPWVNLGIHDVGYVPLAGHPAPTKLAIALGVATADEQLSAYLREMGIDQRLLTEAFAIPFATVGRLSREDAVRFGLDRREFAESVWQFFDKPALAIRKVFFARTDDSKARYINGVVSMFCGRGTDNHTVMTVGREHLSADPADIAGQPPLTLSVNGQDVSLPRVRNDKLFMRQAPVPMAAVDAITDTATLVVPGTELGRQPGPAGDVTLNMLGFAQARAKLQEACLHPPAPVATPPVTVQSPGIPGTSLTKPDPQLAWAVTQPFARGATRTQVDATLGTPVRTIGAVALYTSVLNPGKVMAGYFEIDGRLKRFARYVRKDGKVVDEITTAELSQGQELPSVRALLATPAGAAAGSGAPAPAAAPSH
jgi:hypothetical protein